MKERPILFSAPMVRALLDGTKTQTRRVMKQATGQSLSVESHPKSPGKAILSWLIGDGPGHPVGEQVKVVDCPYGQPGDRLWVREAWRTSPDANAIPPRDLHDSCVITYEADYEPIAGWGKYRPGMFMPRWASRITLEIVGVRVERLQDISEADAIAEGVDRTNTSITGYAQERYRRLWEAINGPGSWDANPWVWVIEFKRVAQ